MTCANAMQKAEHAARYKHGEWFVWQHTDGEWYYAKRANASVVQDAADNVKPDSRVYMIGGGGPHSMTWCRFNASILQLWVRNPVASY